MYCQNQEIKRETNINYSEWQPLIVNRQILSLIVTEPDENIVLNSRKINVKQIMQLEDIQNSLHTQENHSSAIQVPQQPLQSIKLKFLDGEDYLDIYEQLIQDEMLNDKIQKSNFAQTGVKIEWGISLRNKRTATFLFPCSEDLGPS
jgi:regulator of nonsense transcripts 1